MLDQARKVEVLKSDGGRTAVSGENRRGKLCIVNLLLELPHLFANKELINRRLILVARFHWTNSLTFITGNLIATALQRLDSITARAPQNRIERKAPEG